VKREWKWLARIPRIVIRVPKLPKLLNYCIVVQEFFQARVKRGLRQLGKAYSTLNIIGFVMSLPQVGARYMLMSCAYQ
jgi:hypothetical protein